MPTRMRSRAGATEPKPTASAEDGAQASAVRVLRQFRQVFKAVKTHFQQVEKRAGVGGAQLWALAVIQASPGIGVQALARAMDIHQSTASNLVRGLVDLGMIEMQRNAKDRRSVELRALAAGKRVLQRAPGPASGVLPQALSSLDPEVLMRLEKDLSTLLQRLEPDQRAARTPLAEM